jgi:hypothetical protein
VVSADFVVARSADFAGVISAAFMVGSEASMAARM